jgi:hypothetical protein
VDDLARFVLRMQRAHGSFFDEITLPSGAPAGERESLFGAGQAVLGLVLLERELAARPRAGAPARETLNAAIRRAMDRYSERHWHSALLSLFFLEEKRHSLAARAAPTPESDSSRARWHATQRPGCASSSGGAVERHASTANRQRVWK